MKLSGIGHVPDGWAQAAVARILQELGPKQLLWRSEWPHVAAAHAYAPSYPQTLEWLEELVPDEDARGRVLLGETPAALYRLR
ncbi:amidohydrolase family protein [Bradyrhizobium genosp. P]|uniref:amidohydrolase family protein n=1 Tax=Bradyrhizobium genosp. P TaxID=83641 RepID=UPI003CF817FF